MNQILQLASPEQGCIDVPHPVENLIRSEMHLIPGNYSSIIKYCIKSGMEKITPVWNNSDWIITLANPKPIHLYPRARDYTVQASKRSIWGKEYNWNINFVSIYTIFWKDAH